MAQQARSGVARLSDVRVDPPQATLSDARDPTPDQPSTSPRVSPVVSRFGRLAPASRGPDAPIPVTTPSSQPKTAWDVFRDLADRTLRESTHTRVNTPSHAQARTSLGELRDRADDWMREGTQTRPQVMVPTNDPGRRFFEAARTTQRPEWRRAAAIGAWQHRLRGSLPGTAVVGAVRGVAGMAEGVAGVWHWTGLLSDEQLTRVQLVADTPLLNPQVATAQVLDDPKGTLGNPRWWAFQGGQAAASVLSLLGAGGPARLTLSSLMKAPGTAGAAAAAVAGAVESLVEGGSVYSDAKRHGASDEVAGRAAVEAVAVNLPLLSVTNLPLFNPRSARRALNALTAGGVEAAQEGIQQVTSTVAARHYTDRPLSTGVIESVVVGGLTGGVIGAAGRPRRDRAATSPTATSAPVAAMPADKHAGPPTPPQATQSVTTPELAPMASSTPADIDRAQQLIELLARRDALIAQRASRAVTTSQPAHDEALADVERHLQALIGKSPSSDPAPVASKEPGRLPTTAIPATDAADVQPGGYYRLPPDQLAVDVDRFQYKGGVTAEGVTPEARIEGPWHPNRAGILLVWQDPETRRLYVVNGHHRLEAARRLGAPEVVVRVLEPMSPQAARVEGALTNIAEDKGTAVDAAHVLRGGRYTSADLRAAGLTLGRGLAQRGWALAQLTDPIFYRVATGDLDEALGVVIGEAGLSPEDQAAVVSLVDRQRARHRTITPGQLRALIEDVQTSSSVHVTSDQGSLFADVLGEDRAQNTALEKAELRDWLVRQLGKDRRLFGYVAAADRAEALARGGNVINRAASAAIADHARRAQLVVERLASRTGPVNAALTRAAERVLAGEAKAKVRADLIAEVRAVVEDVLRGEPRAPATGEATTHASVPSVMASLADARSPSGEATTEISNPQVVSFGQPITSTDDSADATRAPGARVATTDRLRPGGALDAGISGRGSAQRDGSDSRLPEALRQAVAPIRARGRQLTLSFERDLDLALYMLGRSTANQADYLTFVQELTGLDETVARNLARATAARVRALALAHVKSGQAEDVLRIPNDGRGPVPDRLYLPEAPDAAASEDHGVVDVLSTGERQPRLPGDVGAWRDVHLEMPPIAPVPGTEPDPPVVGSTVVVRPGWQRAGVTIRPGDTALVLDVRPWHGVLSVYVQPEGVEAPFPVFLWEFDRLFQRQPVAAEAASAEIAVVPATAGSPDARPALDEERRLQVGASPRRASQARLFLPHQVIRTDRYYAPPSATAPAVGRPISELETLERIRHVWAIRRGSGGTAPLPVRTGKVGRANARGVYLVRDAMIRLRASADLQTFVHELGHHLDFRWISRQLPHLPMSSYAHELLLLGAATSPPNASLRYQMHEGTAEYFKLWFADPVAAGLAAPQWTQVLAEVRQADPAFNLRLQRTRELVQRFITQSTLVRARAQTDIQPVGLKRRLAAVVSELRATRDWTQSLPARVLEALRWTRQWPWTEMGGVRGVRDALIEGWFDAEREAVKLVADIAVARGGPLRPTERVDLLIKQARRAESIAETMLTDGVMDQAGRFRGPSLKAALRPIADMLEAGPEETNFPNLLHALRAKAIYREAAAQGREALDPGLSEAQADLVIADAQRHHRGRDLIRAAKAVNAHERAVRRWIFEHGGIPRKLFDTLNASPFYVPLQRVMDVITTAASSPRGQPIRRRVGSARPVKNPLENIVRNLTPAVHWTLENRAVGTLVSQVLQTPGLAHLLVEIDPPRVPEVINVSSMKDAIIDLLTHEGVSVPPDLDLDAMVTVWMPAALQVGRQQIVSWLDGGPNGSGQRRFFQVQDEALFHWLQSLGAERTRLALGLVTKPLERFATMLRDGAVQTLEFAFGVNIWRDSLTALFQSRHGFVPGVDTMLGLISVLRRDRYYRHVVLSSGRFSTIGSADRPHIERWVKRHLQSPVVPGLKILRWANPFELMDQIGRVLELSTRVGEGRLAINQRGQQRRVGLIGIAQRLRDAVTGVMPAAPSGWTEEDILLAAVQDAQIVTLPFREGGTYAKVVNRFTPFFNAMLLGFRESWRATRRDPLGTSLTLAALIAAKMALWWANREDEQFQSLRPEQRRSHFWVRAGDAWLTIPVPSGPVGFALGIGDIVLEALYRDADEQTKADLASLAKTSHWALTAVLPVLGRVWAEMAANYDLYRNRPIIALDDVRKQPDLQVDPWTSDTARAAGAVLGMAPGTIEHLGYALQSNRWRLATTWLDPWARKVTELATGRPLPPAPADDFERSRLAVTTGLSRLVRSGVWMSGADPVDRFYRRFAELEGDLGSYRAYRKGYGLTDPEPYKAALIAKYTPEEIRRMRLAKIQIDTLRHQRDRVWLSHTLSSNEKQAALNQISVQIARWASWAIDGSVRPPRKE